MQGLWSKGIRIHRAGRYYLEQRSIACNDEIKSRVEIFFLRAKRNDQGRPRSIVELRLVRRNLALST